MPPIRPRAEDHVTCLDVMDKIHEVPQPLTHGLPPVMARPQHTSHPLAASEQQWSAHQDKIQMTVLRNTQGLHAPFRLLMERRAAAQVSRLPFLPSHHVALDVLTGDDEFIDFADVLGGSDVGEVMGQPHALVEKRLGLL